MRLRFVVPADVEAPTGGNVYDLQVAAALRRQGDVVEVVPCEPDTLSALLARPWSGRTLVDGLLACADPAAVASRPIGVLVHMPLACDPGLSPDRTIELAALERAALAAADAVVATSQWTATYLADHHGVRGVSVAQPGVAAAEVVAGSEPPLLVQLAALLPNKDQLMVVDALSRLRDLPWQARLAGSTERDSVYAAQVRRAVRETELGDRIEITGATDREAAWAGADLALLPSRVEAYGMAVTEALARGIPAVVSSHGGSVEALGSTIAGEQPGVVIDPGDVEGLTAVLRRWLTDSDQRTMLRTRALDRRGTLETWETTAGRLRMALQTR